MINLGYGRFVSANDVSVVAEQKSAKFRATTEGELNGKPASECSEDELTIDAFVVVTPKIGQPIGLRAHDGLVENYAKAVVCAINNGEDVDDPDQYKFVEPDTAVEKVVNMHEAAEANDRASNEAQAESATNN